MSLKRLTSCVNSSEKILRNIWETLLLAWI
jgi:hypothetical protein